MPTRRGRTTEPEKADKAPLDLFSQMSRFAGIGALNTVLTLLIYQVLLLFVPYWLAYTLCFVAGVAFSAVANARFAFGVDLKPIAALRFTAVYVAAYLIGLALLHYLVQSGVSDIVAPFIVIPLLLPLNFFGSRLALGGQNSRDRMQRPTRS